MERTNTTKGGFTYSPNREFSVNKEELNELIRKKAFELWDKRGRKSGHDMDNWLEAEKIVKQKFFL